MKADGGKEVDFAKCDRCGKNIVCRKEKNDHKERERWSLPRYRAVGCKI